MYSENHALLKFQLIFYSSDLNIQLASYSIIITGRLFWQWEIKYCRTNICFRCLKYICILYIIYIFLTWMGWEICAKESATIGWVGLWQTETGIPSKRGAHPLPARCHQGVSVMEKLAVGNQVVEVFRVERSVSFAILIPLEGGTEQHSRAVLSIMWNPNCVSDNVLCHSFSNRSIFHDRPAAKEGRQTADHEYFLLLTFALIYIQLRENHWDPVDWMSYSCVDFVTF